MIKSPLGWRACCAWTSCVALVLLLLCGAQMVDSKRRENRCMKHYFVHTIEHPTKNCEKKVRNKTMPCSMWYSHLDENVFLFVCLLLFFCVVSSSFLGGGFIFLKKMGGEGVRRFLFFFSEKMCLA